MNKQNLINWFVENNYTDITETGYTWNEVGKMFGLSGEAARHIWRRYKNDNQNMKLKSKWQVQTPDGIQWLESYKATEVNEFDITDVLSTVTPFKFEKQYRTLTDNNLIGLYYLADEHIGAEVSGSMYEAPYNKDVFANRLNTIFNSIVQHSKTYGMFKHLIIGNLGDSIDGLNGLTTRGGHILPQNMDIKEVFNTYISYHAGFLTALLNANVCENLYYVAVSDTNHGGDIEYICHKSLQYMMMNTPVKFDIMTNFMEHFIIGNNCFIFTHGKDKTDRKRNMPLVLNDNVENFIKQYIDINGLSAYNISVIKGDLHQSASQKGKFFRYRNTASLFGSSKWAMINFGYTKPMCDYDIIINDEIIEGTIILDNCVKSYANFTI